VNAANVDLVESRLREAMRNALRYNCTVSGHCPLRRDGDVLFCDLIGALVLAYDHMAGTGHDSESDNVWEHAAYLLGISLNDVLSIAEGWDNPNDDRSDDTKRFHAWECMGARLAKEFQCEAEPT